MLVGLLGLFMLLLGKVILVLIFGSLWCVLVLIIIFLDLLVKVLLFINIW